MCSVSVGLRSEGTRKGIEFGIERLIINSVRELRFKRIAKNHWGWGREGKELFRG